MERSDRRSNLHEGERRQKSREAGWIREEWPAKTRKVDWGPFGKVVSP